ncbi:p22-like superoxide-generating NADPH oxidase light subunit [Tieghemostelium lacteum]|uniref:p22-phox n=1 Tax=Tieghemostelium lacteum TaxID=361077 RepID=A0A151ZJ87_TIELA|nr:p22-like superoxide-generating NADPH oxidase light subunit [Tieghemostelium lacteum]|eukprot:KYQ94043.1 p22-like superoxide-generating NADPH oxidase light subunit [Tieghemostelium lacteum]
MIGLAACWILVAGGIMGLWYDRRYVAIYSIVIGVVLYPFFWPLKYLGPLLAIFQQFWVAGILCFGLSILTFFSVPTTLGGIILGIAGVIYIFAAFRGEKGAYFEKKD